VAVSVAHGDTTLWPAEAGPHRRPQLPIIRRYVKFPIKLSDALVEHFRDVILCELHVREHDDIVPHDIPVDRGGIERPIQLFRRAVVLDRTEERAGTVVAVAGENQVFLDQALCRGVDRNEPNRAILKTFLWSGIRLGTACRLKVSDFHQDGDEATLRLHEKGDKRRTHRPALPRRPSHRRIHRQGRLNRRSPLPPARLGPRSQRLAGRPLEASALYLLLQHYLEQLPGAMKEEQLSDGSNARRCIYTPHSLRATIATLLLDGNVDIARHTCWRFD